MSIENFHASDGWFDRWKKRYSVSFKKISGEGNACTNEMTAPWAETTLPTMLSKYELNQIYNADEFGLFYRAQPEKSLHLKDERCVGGKHSKLRLTGLAAANAVGGKLPMFVIGKSKSPRCFKNIKHLPCRYRSQNKSWMDSILFEEWVRKIDRRFTAERKKIALVVDNCPAHPSIDNLVSNDLIFLPPNTTSKLQPMGQGVIRSLKAYYKSLSVRKLIDAIEKNKSLLEFSIHSMQCECLTLHEEKLQKKRLLTAPQKLVFRKKSKSNLCQRLMILSKIYRSSWISLLFMHQSISPKEPLLLTSYLLMTPS